MEANTLCMSTRSLSDIVPLSDDMRQNHGILQQEPVEFLVCLQQQHEASGPTWDCFAHGVVTGLAVAWQDLLGDHSL